jgi:hypothetical protein
LGIKAALEPVQPAKVAPKPSEAAGLGNSCGEVGPGYASFGGIIKGRDHGILNRPGAACHRGG